MRVGARLRTHTGQEAVIRGVSGDFVWIDVFVDGSKFGQLKLPLREVEQLLSGEPRQPTSAPRQRRSAHSPVRPAPPAPPPLTPHPGSAPAVMPSLTPSGSGQGMPLWIKVATSVGAAIGCCVLWYIFLREEPALTAERIYLNIVRDGTYGTYPSSDEELVWQGREVCRQVRVGASAPIHVAPWLRDAGGISLDQALYQIGAATAFCRDIEDQFDR